MIDERFILPILEDEINFHREEWETPIFSLGVRVGLYRIMCMILGICTRGEAIADCLELFKYRVERAIQIQDELTGDWYKLNKDDPHVSRMREDDGINDLFEWQDDWVGDILQ